MKIDNSIPPPSRKRWAHRMTDELKGMRPDDSVLLDHKTAGCLRAWGRKNGWEMTQREETAGKRRVWRIK